jgi:hypothetical protein
MKRLLLAGAAGAALFATALPAHATIISCNNMPVMVRCFSTKYGKWCDVWVAPNTCIVAAELLGPIGT